MRGSLVFGTTTAAFGLLHACCLPSCMENQIRTPFSDMILSEAGTPCSGGGRPGKDIRKLKPGKSQVSGQYDWQIDFEIRKRSFSDAERAF